MEAVKLKVFQISHPLQITSCESPRRMPCQSNSTAVHPIILYLVCTPHDLRLKLTSCHLITVVFLRTRHLTISLLSATNSRLDNARLLARTTARVDMSIQPNRMGVYIKRLHYVFLRVL